MANYCCTIRTNYFHVKDETKFRSLMEQVYGSEDIMLCMVAFLGLHLALGNTDLLLLQGRLHDLRLFRSGFFAACFKFIRLHHRAGKFAAF